MPTLPTYTKCLELGCPNPRAHRSSFCDEHNVMKGKYKRPIPTNRYTHDGLYNSPFWYTTRKAHLSTHPLCACCMTAGIVTQGKHVDHLFPWTQIGEHAFYRNVFQTLCHSCHSTKTHLENNGIYRHYTNTYTDYTKDDYERIVSPLYA